MEGYCSTESWTHWVGNSVVSEKAQQLLPNNHDSVQKIPVNYVKNKFQQSDE